MVIDMTVFMTYYSVMIKLNIHEIKTHLSKYIEVVEGGETVIICKRNIPVAEIRPVEKKHTRKPILGSAEGMGSMRPSFHKPMDEAELAQWETVSGNDPLVAFPAKSKKRRK